MIDCLARGIKSDMGNDYSVRVDRHVPVPMRDGTILHADVYRPDAPGRYPILLQRTCYSKDLPVPGAVLVFPITAASRGYAVVIQDVRGRYSSQGDFYPFLHEAEDGYDTVEWAAAQPWSSGRVGTYGGSYLGATQWLAAVARPPALKAIFPSVTASDFHQGWTYQGGALRLAFVESWALLPLALLNGVSRLGLSADELAAEQWKLAQAVDNFPDTSRFLPLRDFPYLQRPGLAPYFYDWLAHPDRDQYWRRWSIEERHDQITVPAFNLGAWYDPFVDGTIRNFTGMQAGGGSETARRGQKLLIGPWYHSMPLDPRVGDLSLPLAALVDLDALHLRWFDCWLKEMDNGIADEPPVELYVMGENVWRKEREWPLARTEYTRFYLRSGGRANSLSGDGGLSPEPPGSEPPDVFSYDPKDPVPTCGGALCCWPAILKPGVVDQREVEARDDVLVYTSAPLERDLEVTGPVEVTLWTESSAPDTDFSAKLVDVTPDGFARNLCDGIIRARYRESLSSPSPIEPGRVYRYVTALAATSNLFRRGHRIRLEISSGNFPRFDRNPNTGHPFAQDAELRTAAQTVYHDGRYPSHITLPVIPRA